MTKGPAAGPFGCPYRFNGPYDGSSENVAKDKKMWGAWERAISVYNVGYIYVNQARSWMPDPIGGICWYGPDKPFLTCFVPFYVGVLDLPEPYQTCDLMKFDRNSAWWTFNVVSNLAALKFSYMKKDVIDVQQRIEKQELQDIISTDAQALALYDNDPSEAASFLTNFCLGKSEELLNSWHNLSDLLIVKYADGYVNIPEFSQKRRL